jgi:hypothetical protein
LNSSFSILSRVALIDYFIKKYNTVSYIALYILPVEEISAFELGVALV